MTLEERAKEYAKEYYNNPYTDRQEIVDMYMQIANEQFGIFLDAYCKTCCNLERKKCIELDGMCKQYAKLIKNIHEHV